MRVDVLPHDDMEFGSQLQGRPGNITGDELRLIAVEYCYFGRGTKGTKYLGRLREAALAIAESIQG